MSVQPGTVIGTGRIVTVRKQGALLYRAESRSGVGPTRTRREFCLFVIADVTPARLVGRPPVSRRAIGPRICGRTGPAS